MRAVYYPHACVRRSVRKNTVSIVRDEERKRKIYTEHARVFQAIFLGYTFSSSVLQFFRKKPETSLRRLENTVRRRGASRFIAVCIFCRSISPARKRAHKRYRMQIARACDVSARYRAWLLVANSAGRMKRGCGSCQGYDSLECKADGIISYRPRPSDFNRALFLIRLSDAGAVAVRTRLIRCHYARSCVPFSHFSVTSFFPSRNREQD